MNINPNYEEGEEPKETTYEEEMQAYMGFLHEKLITPMLEKLNEEDANILWNLGSSLMHIAKMADEQNTSDKDEKAIVDEKLSTLISDLSQSMEHLNISQTSGDDNTYNVNRN